VKPILVACLLTFFMLSCAQPNYQEPVKLNTPLVDDKPKPPPNNDTTNPTDPPPKLECKHVFAKTQTCLNYKWTKSATATEMGTIDLFLATLEAPQIPVNLNYTVAVVLWMPSMGHGSRPVLVEKNSSFIYIASKIFFIMPGDWEIRFQLKLNNEVVDEYVVKLII
jgi:hypothetical protein